MVEEKKDKYDEGEYDQEGDMAKSDLRSIMANAKELHDMIDDADNLPEWCQNKITLAEDYISTVANYLTAEMSEGAILAKEKTVTVKHKTSGKELVVTAQKAKELKQHDYHPVKEEVSKADVPAYLRKQKGEKPLTMADVKAPRKDSISAKENLAKARNEEVEKHKEIYVHTDMEDGSHQDKNDTKDLHDRVKAAAKKHGATITYQDRPSLRGSHSIAAKGSHEFHKEVKHIASDYEHLGAQHEVFESVEQIDELSNKTLYSYLRKTGAVRSSTEVHPRNTSNVPHDLQYQAQDSAKSRINARKGHGSVAPKGYAKEEVEQIDEKNVPTSPEKWAQAKAQAKAKFDVYPSAYANGWAAKKYKAMGGGWKSVSEAKEEPPFDKPYTTVKKVVTDKSGAKHNPMSRARDIARMAMKKQMEKMKPVKESLEESRKAEIVKEIMKKKKDKSEDAFQKDPELTTTLTKVI